MCCVLSSFHRKMNDTRQKTGVVLILYQMLSRPAIFRDRAKQTNVAIICNAKFANREVLALFSSIERSTTANERVATNMVFTRSARPA